MALHGEYIPGPHPKTWQCTYLIADQRFDVPPRIETLDPGGGGCPHGPYGAKGLGEHVLIPTAPARS